MIRQLPLNDEIRSVLKNIIWFESPEEAIVDLPRVLAYAMTYATHEDMVVLRRYVNDDDFRLLLDKVPPGIIDSKSWAYWNLILGRYPPPPQPVRKLE